MRKSKIFSKYELENIIKPLIDEAYSSMNGKYPYHVDWEDLSENDGHEYTVLAIRIGYESNTNKSKTGTKGNGYYVIVDHEADVGISSRGMARFRNNNNWERKF